MALKIQKSLKVILGAELIHFLVQLVILVLIFACWKFYPEIFQEYIVDDLPKVAEFGKDYYTAVKVLRIVWVITFILNMYLFYCICRGIKQSSPRDLKSWVVFSWFIIVLILITIAQKISQNGVGPYSLLEITILVYIIVSGFYRFWANLVIKRFISKILMDLSQDY